MNAQQANHAHHAQECAEAAKLQTLLNAKYPHCRPEFPGGLYEWAHAALTQDNATLLQHVNAAKTKMQHRDNYVHMVLTSVAVHLSN